MITTSLFIKIDTYIGETLFTADTTMYTADTELFTADKTSLEAGGYASEYQRVELYKDDAIKVTSSVQNYKDLSTITTDYSQTFTVPASKINNEIFSYWYENSIDGGFDHRIRYKAFIEIDGVLFRKGNIQIEKANRNNGYIENYYLTFYGDLISLNDMFKEDKLQLVFGTPIGLSLNHLYTPTEVLLRIQGISPYVGYPLIANDDRYEYMTGSTYDITTTNSIKWDSLFPAVNLKKIFDMIQEYYGITFTGSFLNYQQFTKLSLYLKNAEELTVRSEPLKLLFTTVASELSTPKIVWLNGIGNTPFVTLPAISSSSVVRPLYAPTNQFNINSQQWRLLINPTDDTIPYDIIVKMNGEIINVFYNLIGNQTIIVRNWKTWDITQIDEQYEYYIQSSDIMTFSCGIKVSYISISDMGVWGSQSYNASNPSMTTSGYISLRNYVPDITVSDFITGVLKLFNMLVIPKGDNTYELIPTELYYSSGADLDLSKYFYSQQAEYKKPQLFKQIEFKYETSDNILNNQFRGLFNRDYGDLLYNNDNFSENATYSVNVPFENVMFEKNSIDYNFLTATIWDKDQKPYTPKPILLYRNEITTLDGDNIRIDAGTLGIVTSNGYTKYSNELLLAGSDLSQLMSLNFGSEISPFYLTVASQSLYQRHYSNYIQNLYNAKTRIVNIKALLDAPMMANIKLNDQIFIRDKRYTINNMTMDLTSGETDFELLTNLRPMDSASSIGARASSSIFFLDNTMQTIEMQLFLLNNKEFELLEPYDRSILIYDASGVQRQDYTFEFTVPANDTLALRSDYLEVIYTTETGARQTFQIYVIQDL